MLTFKDKRTQRKGFGILPRPYKLQLLKKPMNSPSRTLIYELENMFGSIKIQSSLMVTHIDALIYELV